MKTTEVEASPDLRRRVGFGLLLIAAVLLLLSFFLQSGTHGTPVTAKIIAWSLGAAALLMGASVLVFGTLKIVWLVKIDLRRGRTMFIVGIPFCSVRLTGRWEAGAFSISERHGVFLVVPTSARLVAIVVFCYLIYGLLANSMSDWYALGIALGLFGVLWAVQSKLRGSPQPGTAASESTG